MSALLCAKTPHSRATYPSGVYCGTYKPFYTPPWWCPCHSYTPQFEAALITKLGIPTQQPRRQWVGDRQYLDPSQMNAKDTTACIREPTKCQLKWLSLGDSQGSVPVGRAIRDRWFAEPRS